MSKQERDKTPCQWDGHRLDRDGICLDCGESFPQENLYDQFEDNIINFHEDRVD